MLYPDTLVRKPCRDGIPALRSSRLAELAATSPAREGERGRVGEYRYDRRRAIEQSHEGLAPSRSAAFRGSEEEVVVSTENRTSAQDQYVSTAETHAGAVIFIGDRVYKLKKPIDLGFLDFRDREARLWACRRELELNRRLAPDVYLGLVDIGPSGDDPCDHALVMRRMPEERSLAALVETGSPVDGAVREIAEELADFHVRAERDERVSAEGSPNAVMQRWDDNIAGLRDFGTGLLDAEMLGGIADRGRDFLDGRAPLLERRVHAGRIVDGHGDLLSEDIFCLDDGPRILDCLEFDDKLRRLDAWDDAACLAMDLEYRGAPDLAQRFLGWYGQYSGDVAPTSLGHFYTAYRALVRTKVACAKHAPGDDATAADARDHLRLAADHIRRAVPQLVMIGGPPGSGKTTLSEQVAARLGLHSLSSDRVRKELAGLSSADSAAADYQSGLYAPEHTDRTYRELADRAAELLTHGESVVLDASWSREQHRELAVDAARRTRSTAVALQCTAPSTTTAERLRHRHRTASDADERVAQSLRGDTDEWPEAIRIDTTSSIARSADDAIEALISSAP